MSIFNYYLMFLNKIHSKRYNKVVQRHYSKKGVVFEGKGPSWFSPDIWIDGYNYKNIVIGENVKISKEVMILGHDYSINHVFKKMNNYGDEKADYCSTGQISIGANTFIGARVTILPNTQIGKNCIIGAGSVVKGRIPDNSVCIGNPCKRICSIEETIAKHIKGDK